MFYFNVLFISINIDDVNNVYCKVACLSKMVVSSELVGYVLQTKRTLMIDNLDVLTYKYFLNIMQPLN